ncbi:hypothetical protein QVD17_15216 [Tagetes erecta]|uniref:Cation-transporting P-type ATPase N-terminal domain-containing protein n=1 Tax=Tagetes erecta TaxID=13708 RepID=A0AAD8NZB3_TARER|nr:hypothetical protein QVD17_15216 [Tagetes erecta]
MEDVAINIGDADQTVPLIQTLDNSLPSGKQIRKVINVHHFIQALKAHAASVATAHVRRDSSSAPKEKPEAAEASDSLAVSSKHHIIGQTAKHCQIEKISKIVRQRDFLTLQQFGGLVGVIDALGTDLDKGISDEEALDRHKELSICLTPTRTFLHFVWKEVKSTTVLLLSLAATLLIIFGTIEEGLQYGWTDGVVLLVCIILYVLISSMHKYWDERKAQKKFQKQQSEEVSVRDCCVKRGSETKNVSESELVYGDILFSKTGCQIPVEGLFVDGEDLELDGFESHIANKQKPFLSYGERVINGEAWMVVTSTNMMIRRATYDLNMRFRLETYLDKLNTYIHLTLIIFSIFIVLVSFLRFTLGKIDDENSNTPESVDKPTGIRIFSNTFAKIIKESKYTTKVLTKLVGVSLVGLTGGVNFVVSLALVYRNKKTLSAKVTEQVSHSILKMAAVTTLICTDTYEELNGDDDMEVQKVVIGVEFISEIRTLSPNVVEALCNGIGTSKENAILHGGIYKLGLNSEKLIQRQQIKEDEEMILHMNGPVNKIMSKCTHYCNIQGEKVFMNDTIRKDFHQTNVDMKCEHKLMTVAVACKHTDAQTQDATEDWVLVALLGLKNKNKEATKAEVKACRECGIEVVIVSSKKLPGLKDIALQYGITTDPPSLVLTGEDFRKYTDKERFENVGKIRVLGEALSSDKLLLVETLRGKGGVVAFLGQITNDTPALIGADIGIAIGNQSSKKAIESSDIIILDENFPQISSMVDSGKCFYYNIQSFIQPVLILTISGALLSLIQTAAWGTDR